MKKLFRVVILLVVFCTIVNASIFVKNGELKFVDDKDFITRCILGYKWIQFVERVGRGDLYSPSGNPQQMFERHRFYHGDITMLPVECDK